MSFRQVHVLVVGILLGMSLLVANSARGQVTETKLTASDGSQADSMGFSVSVSGDTAVIGAPFDDEIGSLVGSVYVFVRSGTTWAQQGELTASDGAAWDRFGMAVSVDGDTAVIGAPYDDDLGTDSGSAYVFQLVRAVPSAPQNLRATAGDGRIDLTWEFSLSDGGSPVTSFRIYRGTISGGLSFFIDAGNVLTYSDNGLTNGIAYYYQVTAVNAIGEGPPSNEASATPMLTPSARYWHAMAYDAESDRIILFGGQMESGWSGETWAYDFNTNTWTSTAPPIVPWPRYGPAMAYDAESDRVILFGGSAGGDETWSYDFNTNTWTNMAAVGPSYRQRQAMAYDSESDKVILFGGLLPGSALSDETWAYDFNTNTWTRMEPAVRPSARAELAAAYDVKSDRVILFSGASYSGTGDDTWAYDFNSDAWTRMAPLSRPSGRTNYAMAVDRESDRVILFGGLLSSGQLSDETWAYDFNMDSWTTAQPAVRPSGRTAHAMAYDAESDRVILFGGWTGSYDRKTWAYDFNADKWRNMEEATKPAAPRNLQAAPGDGRVDLSWAPPTDDGGSPVTSYRIYRGTESGSPAFLVDVGDILGYPDVGVTNGVTYYYQLSAVNAVGEGSLATEVAATPMPLDETPPTVAIVSPTEGAVLASTGVTITGTAADNVAVGKVEVSIDGGATWNLASGTTSWSATVSLDEGPHTIRARAADTAGNVATAVVSVTVDVTPPTVAIVSPAPGITDSSTIEIRWTASDLGSGVDRVVVQFGSDAPIVFPPSASYTIVGVGDGTYPITATAVDRAGNTASDSIVVVVDRTPPDVTITAPASGAYLGSSDVVLTWTSSDATTTVDHYEVSLDGGAPDAFPATTTGHTFLALLDGSHSFGVTAVDGAGNQQTATAVAIVDTTDPTVFLEYPRPEGIVPSSDVRVTWSASDVTSGIDRIEVQLLGGPRTVLPGTAREFTLTGLPDGGAYQFFVDVFDRTGRTKSASVSFFVDTNLPSVQIETPVGGSVLNSSDVLLRWVAFDSPAGILRFEIRLDEGPLVSLGSEQASYTFVGVADGPHTLTVRAFDRVGHDQGVSVSVTIDATPPSLTLASPSAGAVLTSSSIDVRWSSSDATSGLDRIEVALDGGGPETLSAGETRFVLSGLSDGPHTVTVKAYDRARNVATASASFRVDTAIFSPSGPYGYAPIGGLIVGIVAVAAAFVIVRQRRKGRHPGHRG